MLEGVPGPKGDPNSHYMALRGYMNHTIESLKNPNNFENGAIGTLLENLSPKFEKCLQNIKS